MSTIQFRSLDLNLFRVLLALLERRSVTGAAADLALTPSAVSHALGRLRESLGDPLFERRGGLLAPTPYALEVGRRAEPALAQLREATAQQDFDPARTDREFVVAAGSYSAAVLLPPVIEHIRVAAPGLRLRLSLNEPRFIDDIEQGRVDLGFGMEALKSPRLDWMACGREQLAWAARRDHPFIRDPLTMDMLMQAQHVVMDRFRPILAEEYVEARRFFDEGSELRNAYETAVERSMPAQRALTIVSDIAHALAIVRGSNAVTLTLRRFAEAMAPEGLQILTPPHATPTPEIGVLYARNRAHDAGLSWLLGVIGALNPPTQGA